MRKRLLKNLCIATTITLLLPLFGCSKKYIEPISKTELLMGTVCTIKIYDKSSEGILDLAFDRIKEIENEVSINKDESYIIEVNKYSGIKPIKVDDDAFYIVKKGVEYSKLAKGSFDITIGPLVKLWGIGTESAKVPKQEEITEKTALIDYSKIILDEKNKEIYLSKPNMMIDLGAIAKGYVADEVEKVLRDKGVEHAIINMGGNIFAMGSKVNGDNWRIGVQDPFSQRGGIIGSIEVANKSIVTSGIYERYLEKNGKKYHHLLDPKGGYPFENDIAGVTIISNKSVDGDALSTVVFSKGVEEGIKFVDTINDIEAIFITKEKKVYITKGLKGNFKMSNSNFTLMN